MKWRLIGIALVLGAVASPARGDEAAKSRAARILERAGCEGGLVVHVGCGAGQLAVALRADERFLVHGLEANREKVASARQRIGALGLYGPVSVDRFEGETLPYADNLVNLLVADDLGKVPAGEVMRVLAPEGVAMLGDRKVVKSRPANIDEWTHFLRDASGNAVARDEQVDSPRHLQWTAGPKRFRDHDALASMSAMTSSGGRVFSIVDEGATSLIHRPAAWKLVARDAFNGVLLWKREIPQWLTHLYYFRSGPAQLSRRLVSIGDRVYVTLGLAAPVTALDAATGKTLLSFPDSENTEEIVCHKDTLLAVIGAPSMMNEEASKIFGYWELSVSREPNVQKSLVAYEAATGEVRWRTTGPNLAHLAPLSLCADGNQVFFLDHQSLHCLDLNGGEELWQAPFPTKGLFLRNYAPTVVACDGVVMCLTWDRLHAFSAEDGERLWALDKGSIGFAAPGDLFAIHGVAWTIPQTASIWRENKLDRQGKIVSGVPIPRERFLGDRGKEIVGIDMRTGEVVRRISEERVLPGGHHHRCYRNKATERFLICGRRGLEYVDVESADFVNNWWVRGACQYGVMPANGYIYVPPDPCQCFNLIKMNGFLAMSAGNSLDEADLGGRGTLETGPAYEPVADPNSPADGGSDAAAPGASPDAPPWQPPIRASGAGEWPTFRGDITRSGSTPVPVPASLETKWEKTIGGQLTSCVVADGKLVVGRKDTCSVHCCDASTGESLWRFIAGGTVDSPPTISDGLCVFGCRDGAVYCLRLADGGLAWKFRGVPVDRRIVADSRLESVWPVHGSVLVQGGIVYFAAGRSSYLDGGVRLFGIGLHSGKEICRARISAGPVCSGKQQPSDSIGALSDVLVSDGRLINMRHLQFDAELNRRDRGALRTLCATTGLLEDTWFHRQNWVLAHPARVNPHGRAPSLGTRRKGRAAATGKLISFDDHCAYTVSNPYTQLKYTPAMQPKNQDGHLHQKYSRYMPGDFPIGATVSAWRSGSESGGGAEKPSPASTREAWSFDDAIQVRAMLLADEALFLAGWKDAVAVDPATGRPLPPSRPDPRPAFLRVVDTEDGAALAEYPLESEPVFDGMASSHGRLYVPLQSGTVVCLGAGSHTEP